MRYKEALVFAGMLVIALNLRSQMLSVLGKPQACRGNLDRIVVMVPVQHKFTNDTPQQLTLEIGRSRAESFYLFTSTNSIDPSAAIYSNNPDSVAPPAVRQYKLEPGQEHKWSSLAKIFMAEEGRPPFGLPEPGLYYLLPLPDVREVAPAQNNIAQSVSQLLEVRLKPPSGKMNRCK